MPRGYITLADLKKLAVFWTNLDPDNPGVDINIQEFLHGDIPTYSVVVDATPALNKNLLTIFNNLPPPPSPASKRIRIQEIYAYPKTLANHVVTLQVGYINSVPPDGTDVSVNRFAFDYATPPDPPNTIVVKSGNTTPTPVALGAFGGTTFNLNTAGTCIIFQPPVRNGSALILRPQAANSPPDPQSAEGITVRQTSGSGTTGSIGLCAVLTVD